MLRKSCIKKNIKGKKEWEKKKTRWKSGTGSKNKCKAIKEQFGIQDIKRFIKTKKTKWDDHVTRTMKVGLVKIAQDAIPCGKRELPKVRTRAGYPLR